MKKQPELSELNIVELNKKLSISTTATWFLGIIILLQFAVGIYLTTQKGFSVFTILPVCFIPVLLVNFASIKKIKGEIANRK